MEDNIRVALEESGLRLDKFVTLRVPALSRSFAQQLIEEGQVRVDGQARKSNFHVRGGQIVSLHVPPPDRATARGENIPLDIIFEDEAILVINKPAGMVVHPAAGHASGTLVNAVLGHSPDLLVGNAERPGIVHRLDRDTSGVLVMAKNDAALASLQKQFASRRVRKIYLALVNGRVNVRQGKIDAPLKRDHHDRKRFAVVNSSTARQAVTNFRVLQELPGYTLLEVQPETGRTHQIRVHFAFIHHPVVGDAVYGRSARNALGLDRHFLHAFTLIFEHPTRGTEMEFSAAMPHDLGTALARAGGDPKPFQSAIWSGPQI